jgi:hypothetical protein
VLSDDDRKRRRRLSQARSKVKQFETQARRAELRAAFWRRRVADIQFEQRAAYQPPLWPPEHSAGTKHEALDPDLPTAGFEP